MSSTLQYLNSAAHPLALLGPYNHLGRGVFETMLATFHPHKRRVHIFAWGRHLLRLREGAQIIGVSCPVQESILQTLSSACRTFDWGSSPVAVLRITLLLADWLLTLEPWSPSMDSCSGICAVTLEMERAVPQVKSCSALPSVLAREFAKRENAAEALLIDRDGILREGAWSNFFWVDRRGTLITPKTRMLQGITRASVLQMAAHHFPVDLRDSSSSEITTNAAEAFITQSTHGIVPVVSIDRKEIGSGSPGELTRLLGERYADHFRRQTSPDAAVIALDPV